MSLLLLNITKLITLHSADVSLLLLNLTKLISLHSADVFIVTEYN